MPFVHEVTDLQRQVIDAARNRLKYNVWFRGVCLDRLPDDEEIKGNFEMSVSLLVMDTEFWDAPTN